MSCRGTTQFTNLLNTGWHHLAFVRTGSTLKLFIDGAQEGNNFTIGRRQSTIPAMPCASAQWASAPPSTWTGGSMNCASVSASRVRPRILPPPQVAVLQRRRSRHAGCIPRAPATAAGRSSPAPPPSYFTWSLAGWTDVSRTTGGAYNVPPTELWVFEQSGTKLVAVNVNDDPQVIDIDTGSNFAALGGLAAARRPRQADRRFSVPVAARQQRRGFNNRSIIWSGINDITSWTIGLNLCDMQEFPDGGPVQGVAGGEIGYVVQDRAIRTMQFLPGDTTFIFNFSRVLHDRGCISKYGFATIGNVLYFLAEDGFYSLTGQQVTPIGADKVNEWFLANSDVTRRDVVHCIAGVNKPRMVWVFHASSASPMYDKQIIFDWSNGRWAKASVAAQVWGLLASPGLDLDTTGTEIRGCAARQRRPAA